MWEEIKTNAIKFFQSSGITLLKALAVLVISILALRILMKIFKTLFSKTKMDKITQSFLISIIKFILYICIILLVANQLGISTTGLVALLTTASLAIGLSLQDSLSNLANGIVIITTKPFRESDYVSINGIEGKVKNIKMLTTAIVTLDNKLVVLPNSSIVTNNIINYSILGKRRIDLLFDVAYESDVKLVGNIINSVMRSNGKVYLDPEPFVSLKTLDSSSLKFFAYCWVDADDYWDTYYYIMNEVFNEFKKNKVSIPFNQMEVRLRNDNVKMPYDKKPIPARVEKIRLDDKKTIFGDFIRLGHHKTINSVAIDTFKNKTLPETAILKNTKEKSKNKKQLSKIDTDKDNTVKTKSKNTQINNKKTAPISKEKSATKNKDKTLAKEETKSHKTKISGEKPQTIKNKKAKSK